MYGSGPCRDFVWIFLACLAVHVCIFSGLVAGIGACIEWQPFRPEHLHTEPRSYYTYTFDAYVSVPMSHDPPEKQRHNTRGKTLRLYIRKFSSTAHPKRHVWFIAGGPGSSTNSVERAMSVLMPDTAIYLMDPRGLGQSHELCPRDRARSCLLDPAQTFAAFPYPPHVFSMHETAKDYNYLSKCILNESRGRSVFLYGSSYGAMVAYRAFLFEPMLYQGILLDGFMPRYRLDHSADIGRHIANSCLSSSFCSKLFPLKTHAEIEDLVHRILDDSNRNGCKLAFQFQGGRNERALKPHLDWTIRMLLLRDPRYRGVLLPFLYHMAECPSPTRFLKMLSVVTEMTSGQDAKTADAAKADLAASCHATYRPERNEFYGRYISYSEVSVEDPKLLESCKKFGHVRLRSVVDPCFMLSDYGSGLEPYLYVPQIPSFSETLKWSPTRVVMLAGKWDSQTPYDLALAEFKKLPVPEKYLFVGDHMGHGVMNSSVQAPPLSLILGFLMDGSEQKRQQIVAFFSAQNADADWVWKVTRSAGVSNHVDFWNFSFKSDSFDMRKFSVIFVGLLSVPLLTFYLLLTKRQPV